jgi:hypothetical protein
MTELLEFIRGGTAIDIHWPGINDKRTFSGFEIGHETDIKIQFDDHIIAISTFCSAALCSIFHQIQSGQKNTY